MARWGPQEGSMRPVKIVKNLDFTKKLGYYAYFFQRINFLTENFNVIFLSHMRPASQFEFETLDLDVV